MSEGSLAVDVATAVATTAAVIVALWIASERSPPSAVPSKWKVDGKQRSRSRDGPRQPRPEYWSGTVRSIGDPRPRTEHGPETGIEPGYIVPPSQGRLGPSIEATIAAFDSIRGSARLSFGPSHEVTCLVDQVIAAIQHIADRGVIYAEEQGPTPREYVDRTLLPLNADLFEALAETTDLRDPNERRLRSGVQATDHRPGRYT